MPGSASPRLLYWDEASRHGAAVAVTTRGGGLSEQPYDSLNLGLHVEDRAEAVAANRTRAAEAFGVPLANLVFAQQVHGTTVALVGPAERGRGTASTDDAIPGTDALVTASAGITLAILVADCVPVALLDPVARVLAVVHAGWRGTAAGAVAHALAAMEAQGAEAARTLAYLGPAVAPERYQVSNDVQRALAGAVEPDPLDAAVARPDGTDHWLVDLVAANRQQLLRAGVGAEHITTSGVSTSDPDFFSDRAARPCGRFGLFARLLE
jgi:YfiH family protein